MQTQNWKIVLAVLTANVVMMAAGYTMLIPFLPMYLMRELGVAPEHVKLWTGAVFSITFLIGGIMAPIWGRMADTKGKKLMALRSSTGLALSYFLGGVVAGPEQMFLVRALQGFAAGLWSVCLAICTSSVPVAKLGVSLGILQAGLIAGNVIGPLVGGTLATLVGMRASFFVAGTLLTLIAVVFYVFVPEPPKTPVTETGEGSSRRLQEDVDTSLPLLRRPLVRETLTYTALVQMVILLIQPVLALYVEELNHSAENIMFLSGAVFSLMGIASAITAPFWGRFGQRRGFHLALALATGMSAAAACLVALPDTLWLFAACNFVYGMCFAGINPSLSAVLAQFSSQAEKGRVFGYMFSAQQFGSMVGPLIGGAVGTYLPLKTLFFLSAAVLAVISALVWRRHHLHMRA